MVEFQVEFLKTLEDGTRLVPDLEKLERVEQFKVWSNFLFKHIRTQQQKPIFFLLPFQQKILFSLGGSFLYYADRFKIYSAFCASHTKVPKVLVKGKLTLVICPIYDVPSIKALELSPRWLSSTFSL